MSRVPPEVLAFYESGREVGRLSDGQLAGPLEFARTTELLTRFLPSHPSRVLDVGGGPGVYSQWLLEHGHSVELVDPVSRHVELARSAGVEARVGEATHLEEPDGSLDVVRLMGPLYHLLEEADRLQALREARRVLRPGGLLIGTAISRYAALLDQLIRLDRFHDPEELARIIDIVATGLLPARPGGVFTAAFFHLPRQLNREVTEGGFDNVQVLAIEGPAFMVTNFDERWASDTRREALLTAARLVESEPEILAATSHLMVVGLRIDH